MLSPSSRLSTCLLVCLSLLLGVTHQAHAQGLSSVPGSSSVEPVQERLENGLDVVVFPDPSIPVVAIHLCYYVGEVDDPSDQPGLAQLIARMIPEASSAHLRGGIRPTLIETTGLAAYKPNLDVRTDLTILSVVVPSATAEFALWLEAERLGFMRTGMTGSLLSYARSLSKDPGGFSWPAMTQFLRAATFPPSHPYAYLTASRLDTVTVESIRDRISRHYQPGNASLVVVGDVNPERIAARIRQYFGALPGTPTAKPPRLPLEPKAKTIVQRHEGRGPIVGWSWPSPAYTADGDESLDVFARYLTLRLGSSGDEKIQREDAPFVRQASSHRASNFLIVGAVNADRTIQNWEARVTREIDAVRRGEIDVNQLRTARDAIKRDIARTEGDLPERAHFIAEFARLTGNPSYMTTYYRKYDETDAARLQDVVRRYIDPSTATRVHFVPHGDEPATTYESLLPPRTYLPPSPQAPTPGSSVAANSDLWLRPPGISATTRLRRPEAIDETHGRARVIALLEPKTPLERVHVSLSWSSRPPRPETRMEVRKLVEEGILANGTTLCRSLARLGASCEVHADSDVLRVSSAVVPERTREVLELLQTSLEELAQPAPADRASASSTAPAAVTERDALLDLQWSRLFPDHRYGARFTPPESRDDWRADAARTLQTELRTSRIQYLFVGRLPVREALGESLRLIEKRPLRSQKPPAVKQVTPARGAFLEEIAEQKYVDLQLVWPLPRENSFYNPLDQALRNLLFDEAEDKRFGATNATAGVLGLAEFSALEYRVRVPPNQFIAYLEAFIARVARVEKGNVAEDAIARARRNTQMFLARRLEGAESLEQWLFATAKTGRSLDTLFDAYDTSRHMTATSVAERAHVVFAQGQMRLFATGPVDSFRTELMTLLQMPVVVVSEVKKK